MSASNNDNRQSRRQDELEQDSMTVQQALDHPWFQKPCVPLGDEDVDSIDENETPAEEAEAAVEEENVTGRSTVVTPIQAIPEESELQEESVPSLGQSAASSRRGSQG